MILLQDTRFVIAVILIVEVLQYVKYNIVKNSIIQIWGDVQEEIRGGS